MEVLSEGGVGLNLNVTEMLGYGEAHGEALKTIIKKTESFLKGPLDKHLHLEHAGLVEPYSGPEDIIHTVVFCLPPNSLGLSSKDKQFLAAIKDLAFVLPIITKADSYTTEELTARKLRLRRDLEAVGIPILPDSIDPYYEPVYEEIKQKWPLAVISSTSKTKTQHGLVRARAYPWGFVDIDDDNYNDLGLLQKILFKYLLAKLHIYAYENVYSLYRRHHIGEVAKKYTPSQLAESIIAGHTIPSLLDTKPSKNDTFVQKALLKLRVSSESAEKLAA